MPTLESRPGSLRPTRLAKSIGRLSLVVLAGLAGLTFQDLGVAQDSNRNRGKESSSLRRKAIGECRDLANKPWVKATVTLVSRVLPGVEGAGEVDVLTTETDERGRFRVPVLQHRRYSVWASAPVADSAKQAQRFSAIVDHAIAGRPILLGEQKRRVVPTKFRITGLTAWKEYAPFEVRIISGGAYHQSIPLELRFAASEDSQPQTDQATCMAPPMPGAQFAFQLTARGGRLLSTRNCKPRNKAPRKSIRIAVPAPATFRVDVRDVNTGDGLAGATIYSTGSGRLVAVGKAGGDGVAELILPRGKLRQRQSIITIGSVPVFIQYFVGAAGYAMAPLQMSAPNNLKKNGWASLRKPKLNAKGRPILQKVHGHANLDKGLSFTGRILLAPGKPAKNLCLLVQGSAMHFHGKRSRHVSAYRNLLRTDAEGRFVIHNCLDEDSYHSHFDVLLSPDQLLELPAEWRSRIASRIHNISELTKKAAVEKTDLGDIDLSGLCPVELTITNPRGVPDTEAQVSICSTDHQVSSVSARDRMQTDRLGRVCFLARPGERILVVAQSEHGLVARGLEAHAVRGDRSFAELDLRLERLLKISGKVTTTKGKPVAGMSLHCHASWGRGGLAPIAVEVEGEIDVSDRNTARLTALIRNEAHAVLSRFAASKPVITAKDGSFTLRVSKSIGQYQIYGHRSVLIFGSQRVRHTVSHEGEDVTDLELEAK